jgi:LPXTG-motif cell wall-anchored protein
MWVKRTLIGSGLAVASVLMVPTVAGAAGTADCTPTYTMTQPASCVTNADVDGSTAAVAPTAATTTATTAATPGATDPVASTTSLPFTGADVEELAVVGGGAVLAGALLLRRRRRTA